MQPRTQASPPPSDKEAARAFLDDMRAFDGRRLRAAIAAEGVSATEAARVLGLSKSLVSRLIAGKRKLTLPVYIALREHYPAAFETLVAE